ncbi:MAG: response regulator [Actinomycetota bacterium]
MNDRILVAEDDADTYAFIEITLRLDGFEITHAPDGEAAVKAAVENPPDLLLLDVMMPGMNGFEVCKRLRRDPRTRNLPIIMLTSKSLPADRVLGLTNGADDYILKPCEPVELVARVSSTLRRTREMRDLNPLSGLSGNIALQREVESHIASSEPFALLYIDLDHFKAFNDFYGFARGDIALTLVSRILQETVFKHDYESGSVFHIGGDDFAIVCQASKAEVIAADVVANFDVQVVDCYDSAEQERGRLTTTDRQGKINDFPIMTVSIGAATNTNRQIGSYPEAAEIASEMKRFAKRHKVSHYAADSRSRDDGELPG